MKALALIWLLATPGVLFAQVSLTPVNQRALFISSQTNNLDLSTTTQIISGLRPGMTQSGIDQHLNAHGMTNRFRVSLDRGHHYTCDYDFPGTDSSLVLQTRSQPTGPGLFDWGNPVLESARIQRYGVDTFVITFTNAPHEEPDRSRSQ